MKQICSRENICDRSVVHSQRGKAATDELKRLKKLNELNEGHRICERARNFRKLRKL